MKGRRSELLKSRHTRNQRLPWIALAGFAGVLLGLFFSYPLARPVFVPATAMVALVTLFRPVWGLGLLILGSLPSLPVPLVLKLPYFSGAEPLVWAFLLGVGLHQAVRPAALPLSPWARFWLILFCLAVTASCGLVVSSLNALPEDWPNAVLRDAGAKVFFWRWGSPLHVLRMSLLLLTGPAVFVAALAALRERTELGRRTVFAAFGLLALFLAAVSAYDLLWRGKSLSLYPGFGPVFTDRNAYAAFWVMTAPLAWVAALTCRGWKRPAAGGVFLLSAVFCGVSLSFTGWFAWLLAVVSATLWLRLRRDGRVLRRIVTGLVCLGVVAVVSMAVDLHFKDPLRLDRRVDSRIGYWLPAWEVFEDRPLLGHGPGEFYRLVPAYRERFDDLPKVSRARENVHNYYLQLAAETGLLGLVGFLGLVTVVLAGAFRMTLADSRDAPDSRDSRLYIAVGTALLGLLAFSITQHPLLRLEFQLWFWVLAACAVSVNHTDDANDANPEKSAKSAKRLTGTWALGLAALIVIAAAAAQAAFWGTTDRTSFAYGWHGENGARSSPPAKGVYWTEAVAFLRRPAAEAPERMELRCLPEESRAYIQLYLNGAWYLVGVDREGSSWDLQLAGEDPVEVGVRRWDPAPVAFADSWGGGVEVRFF